MKRLMFAAIAGAVLLSGCGEELQITAKPIKNVEDVKYQDGNLDVYCLTGICQFELSSNQDVDLNVTMHYSESRSFEKIEGVSVTGRGGSTVQMQGGKSFQLSLEANDPPSTIQVVDYYRN